MNLNYENLHLEGLSDDTLSKYAFPKDKEFLKRYIQGGPTLLTKEEQEKNSKKIMLLTLGGFLVFAAGAAGYFSLLNPAGKVLRDGYDATLPFWRRATRRVLPFTLMVLPFIAARECLNQKSYDYKEWVKK